MRPLAASGGPQQATDDRRSRPCEGADPALPVEDRALWATLFFATLRIGEARALRWRKVEFDADVIVVDHGWDEVEGEQDAKTDAGGGWCRSSANCARSSPRTSSRPAAATTTFASAGPRATRSSGRRSGRSRSAPGGEKQEPSPDGARQKDGRAKLVWVKAREDALEPVTPHGARHTCASYLIAAGANDKALQEVVGHSDVRTTKNVYGHLLPGALDEVRGQLDTFLAQGTHRGPGGTVSGGCSGRGAVNPPCFSGDRL